MAKAKTRNPLVKVCKVCVALPILAPGAVREPGVEYRPKVNRPANHPGPRCATHARDRASEVKARLHGNRVEKIYGITAEEYWRIYEFQDGKCYICHRATGATKRLAVDHDHKTDEVRGLLCGPCNQGVLGHLHSSIEALQRAIDYLQDPPAQRLLKASA